MINYNLKQENFISQYFRLDSPSSKGWRNNLSGCPYCHDGKSKNPRSHFLFTNEEIGWQCFNCGVKHRFGSTNINTLATFISKSAWKKVGAILLELKKDKIFPSVDLKEQEHIKDEVGEDNLELINYKEIELPDVSMPFNMDVSKISRAYQRRFKENKLKATQYLKEHGFTDTNKIKNLYICMEGDYSNRLIFPIYFDGKLISWSARALFPTKTKFMYPPSDENFNERGKIIYGLDKLFKSEDVKQIFVTESIIDAMHLDGMAVLSKNLTKDQIEILKNFNLQNKKLVFVLDNDTVTKWDTDLKGGELGKIVMNQHQSNWFVSLPNFGQGIKDVSDSIIKNGKLETYDKIMSSFIENSSNLEMKIKLNSSAFKRKWKQNH